MKQLITGDEAVARGAWEAGVRFAAAYPGTPSTEILENIATYKEIHSEWAPNEKTALESVIGASLAGARAPETQAHAARQHGRNTRRAAKCLAIHHRRFQATRPWRQSQMSRRWKVC